MSYTVEALRAIKPKAKWALDGDEILWVDEIGEDGVPTGVVLTPNFQWLDDKQSKPTQAEVEAEIINQQNLFNNSEYQRLRQPEYPPLADLADALYWQTQGDDSKMTAYLAAVEAVKQKYPKGV
jgi:hypothetical protein